MRPLTPGVWERHFTVLRPYVRQEFPEVDRQKLEIIGDDYSGLVEVVQDATGLSAELVRQRLKKLDVDELGLGTGQDREEEEEEEEEEEDEGDASLAQLRLGDGFTDAERDRVVSRLEKLNRRLRKFPADGTDLLLTVKERGTASQKVTLECGLPHFPPLVATSNEPDLQAALMEVREDLWRLIDDAVNKRKQGVS
jgi:ribosome-associated translation inhibitor RaiA